MPGKNDPDLIGLLSSSFYAREGIYTMIWYLNPGHNRNTRLLVLSFFLLRGSTGNFVAGSSFRSQGIQIPAFRLPFFSPLSVGSH